MRLRHFIALPGLLLLPATHSLGQEFPPGFLDPEPILQAAEAAIGADRLSCVSVTGSGYSGMVGAAASQRL